MWEGLQGHPWLTLRDWANQAMDASLYNLTPNVGESRGDMKQKLLMGNHLFPGTDILYNMAFAVISVYALAVPEINQLCC